jgi:hypothetical protein
VHTLCEPPVDETGINVNSPHKIHYMFDIDNFYSRHARFSMYCEWC